MSKIEENLFFEFWNNLNKATDIGISQSDNTQVDAEFCQSLKYNNAVFASFKAHRMGEDMTELLRDSKGGLKPFEQWLNDVRPIADHQVYSWFKTEYVTAVNRARHAANWEEFKRTSEALPNLKWRPSTAASPREIHSMFYGLVLPIEHSFWYQHSPGDMWNCQCGLLATDDERTPEDKIPASNYVRAKGLDNNPADDGKLFNDTHPYFPSKCEMCKLKHNSKGSTASNLLFNAKDRDCYNCPIVSKIVEDLVDGKISQRKQHYEQLLENENYYNVQFDSKNGGLMATHKKHNLDSKKGDYEVNVQKAGFLNGDSVILDEENHSELHKRNVEGIWNGNTFEIKGCETRSSSNIMRGFTHAKSKNADIAVLYFLEDYDDEDFEEALFRYNNLRIKEPHRWKKFKEIICIVGDKIRYKKSHQI